MACVERARSARSPPDDAASAIAKAYGRRFQRNHKRHHWTVLDGRLDQAEGRPAQKRGSAH
eukprot:1710532-Prymnesium_polylepis.1